MRGGRTEKIKPKLGILVGQAVGCILSCENLLYFFLVNQRLEMESRPIHSICPFKVVIRRIRT